MMRLILVAFAIMAATVLCIPQESPPAPAPPPITCPPDFKRCPGFLDLNGRKLPDSCVPKQMGTNGPCDPPCPLQCKVGETLCPTGFDANDCPKPHSCVEREVTVGDDARPCRRHICPRICPKGQIVCPGGFDGNGCQSNDYCTMNATCPETPKNN